MEKNINENQKGIETDYNNLSEYFLYLGGLTKKKNKKEINETTTKIIDFINKNKSTSIDVLNHMIYYTLQYGCETLSIKIKESFYKLYKLLSEIKGGGDGLESNNNNNLYKDENEDNDKKDKFMKNGYLHCLFKPFEVITYEQNENDSDNDIAKPKINNKFNKDTCYKFDENLFKEIMDSILQKNRLKIYEPYLLSFPESFKLFRDTINNIIYSQGQSFPFQEKFFLCIMGASTIGCEYLVNEFKRKFLLSGGNASWLINGLKEEKMPEQIKNLSQLNNLLAHKPWVIQECHIKETKMNIELLCISVLILTTVQRFATIISSLKLVIETNNYIKDSQKGINVGKKTLTENEEETKAIKLNIYKELEKAENERSVEPTPNNSSKNKINDKAIKELYHECSPVIEYSKENPYSKYISKYISSFNNKYQNFQTDVEYFLSKYDFNWEDDAKYLLSKYADEYIEYIIKEHDYLTTVTSNNIGKYKKIVDTRKFREAIAIYVELIYGIIDDSYNYKKTNKILTKEFKCVLKKIACFPEQINQEDLDYTLQIISLEEVIHVILMISIIKQHISLTFFAKVIYELNRKNNL